MENFAALTSLAVLYIGISCLYLVGYWLLTFGKYKTKPNVGSLLALVCSFLALWQAKQIGGGPTGYSMLFVACICVTCALMVAFSVVSNARTKAAIN